ncbi:MAG: adenosylcobinamide-GDP ribazoletransferase [Rhodospirillaceae bacterium]
MSAEKPDHNADADEAGPAPETGAAGGTPPANSLMDQVRLALAFLTRIPSGVNHDGGTGALARAAWAFPLIGVLIGGLGGGVVMLTSGSGLHPLACALLALAVMAAVTGALHEDGLADFADGLGGQTRERRLDIMADPRIGAFGVLALIFSVGLRSTALMSLSGPGIACATMIAAAGLSRAGMVLAMHWLSPARQGGLGHGAGRPSQTVTIAAVALGLAAAVPLLWINGVGVIGILGAAFAAALFTGWAMHAALGGQTGDGLGAQQQATETAIYLAAAGAGVIL